MRRPVIGITTYRERASWGVWQRPADLLGAVYADAVADAGGAPVLLPPLPGVVVDALPALDGLVLAGGADVDPQHYDAARNPATGAARPDRDQTEIELARACLGSDVPLLAICRGMQVLNVALGGTLVQHLPDVAGAAAHRAGDGRFHQRTVDVASDSLLASLVGSELEVHCYHHQAVDRLADGLRAVAWSEDGVIEAVEPVTTTRPAGFLLAVQAHPEESADRRLFAALADAAARTRAAR